MHRTELTFLGTAAAIPGPYQETASYLIDGTLLIDCGWHCAVKMLEYGHDPLTVETLFFTHFHPDHYLGFPGLLWYRGLEGSRRGIRPTLRVVGPAEELPQVIEQTRRFLQAERFAKHWPDVEILPLERGATFEAEGYRIETIPSYHGVPGTCLRYTDHRSGAVIVFSSDTAPHPDLPRFARGADLLVHEANSPPDTPEDALRGHSRAPDAARIAADAGVRRLRLVHLAGGHEQESLTAARATFPEAALAQPGEVLRLPS